MRNLFHKDGQGGFTLAEAVIVIVIIGIIGSILAVFIKGPVLNYRDTVLRADMTDMADLALRRMARDLRLALPNSIRVSSDGASIEFLMTKTGGRYLAVEDGVATGQPLDFTDSDKKSFTMLGLLPTGKQAIVPGSDYVVVNNMGPGFSTLDAYLVNSSAPHNAAKITGVISVSTGQQTITMGDNPFALQAPPMPSPSSRFQIVSGPVTYYCVPGTDGTGTRSQLPRIRRRPALDSKAT